MFSATWSWAFWKASLVNMDSKLGLGTSRWFSFGCSALESVSFPNDFFESIPPVSPVSSLPLVSKLA